MNKSIPSTCYIKSEGILLNCTGIQICKSVSSFKLFVHLRSLNQRGTREVFFGGGRSSMSELVTPKLYELKGILIYLLV